MDSATTPAEILRNTTSFLSIVVSHHKLRHRLISTLRHDITTPLSDEATVNLAAETLENAISFSVSAKQSFSISLAEKLLLPLPDHPLHSFLLSLLHTLRHRHLNAAVSLLRIFRSAPSLTRSEIALVLYDSLFSLHLLPVFRWLQDRRKEIVAGISSGYLLSKMSEDEAAKLKELEREYEEVLDENCRAVALHFEEVLVSEIKEKDSSSGLPWMKLKSVVDMRKENSKEEEKMEESESSVLKNGHVNVSVMLIGRNNKDK